MENLKIMNDCKCEYCGNLFQRERRIILRTRRQGKGLFCRRKCLSNSRVACEETFCLWCKVKIERRSSLSEYLRKCCSRDCAIRYVSNLPREETNRKISLALKGRPCTNLKYRKLDNVKIIVLNEKICVFCSKTFSTTNPKKKYCSFRCCGFRSAQKRVKRSLNEVHFAELCKTVFDEVLTNEPMFDGWDADVILPKFKIAILWNGPWHYRKVTATHSLKQSQMRDTIKLDRIIKNGYTPYVIRDDGRKNKKFVIAEFEKFKFFVEH